MLNGVSSGLLLFMLSSGLTLIFSMMGVLNFAHASFYMLGAYFGYALTSLCRLLAGAGAGAAGWSALLGALFERYCLRRVHKFGHVPELLITFGLSYVMLELVKLIWGLSSLPVAPPAAAAGRRVHDHPIRRRRPEPALGRCAGRALCRRRRRGGALLDLPGDPRCS